VEQVAHQVQAEIMEQLEEILHLAQSHLMVAGMAVLF
jgi:hypothetical protein